MPEKKKEKRKKKEQSRYDSAPGFPALFFFSLLSADSKKTCIVE
jgi:hypothetical protein